VSRIAFVVPPFYQQHLQSSLLSFTQMAQKRALPIGLVVSIKTTVAIGLEPMVKNKKGEKE
jgi:hypothetical protein